MSATPVLVYSVPTMITAVGESSDTLLELEDSQDATEILGVVDPPAILVWGHPTLLVDDSDYHIENENSELLEIPDPPAVLVWGGVIPH